MHFYRLLLKISLACASLLLILVIFPSPKSGVQASESADYISRPEFYAAVPDMVTCYWTGQEAVGGNANNAVGNITSMETTPERNHLQLGCVQDSSGNWILPYTVGACDAAHTNEYGTLDMACLCPPGHCKLRVPGMLNCAKNTNGAQWNLYLGGEPVFSNVCLFDFTGSKYRFFKPADCDESLEDKYDFDLAQVKEKCSGVGSPTTFSFKDKVGCAGYDSTPEGATEEKDKANTEIVYCYPQGSIVPVTQYSFDHNNQETVDSSGSYILRIPAGFICNGYEWITPADYSGEDLEDIRSLSSFPNCDLSGFFEYDLYGDPQPGVSTAIGCIPRTLPGIVAALLRIGLGIAGAVAFGVVVFGIILISSAADNPEQVKKGQKMAINGVIGLVVIISSITIMMILGVQILRIPAFGGDFLQRVLKQGAYE